MNSASSGDGKMVTVPSRGELPQTAANLIECRLQDTIQDVVLLQAAAPVMTESDMVGI